MPTNMSNYTSKWTNGVRVMTQMKDRTNTADDYILRAGVMYSLARYYRKRGKTQFANQCLSLHSFCLDKLKKYKVKFIEHPNGTIEFYENKHQYLYVGKRPEWVRYG